MDQKRSLTIRMSAGSSLDGLTLPPNSKLSKVNQSHIITFGVPVRLENDIEVALDWTLRHSKHLDFALIQEELIDLETFLPVEINANPLGSIPKENQSKEIIFVSKDLSKIYSRVFEFDQNPKNGFFGLKGKKQIPQRVRGIEASHAPMIGRTKELDYFIETLEQSREDEGQVLSIVGEAGIGKSRLKEEFIKHLIKTNHPFVEANYSIQSSQTSHAFQRVIEGLVEQNSTFSKWNLNPTESDFIQFLIAPEQDNPRIQALNEQDIEAGMFHSVRKLIHTVGEKSLCIILDDVHWAGDLSTRLLDYIVDGLEDTKISLILFHRPDYSPTFYRQLNYNELYLQPFDEEDIRNFVSERLDLDYVSMQATKRLTDLSHGNPLYIEEMIRELQLRNELKLLVFEGKNKMVRFDFDPKLVPTNINTLITSRFDILKPQLKNALHWLAIFGIEEDTHEAIEILQELAGLPEETLQELFELQYIEETSFFPKRMYRFYHDLSYQIILEQVSQREKQRINASIAQWLEKKYSDERPYQIEKIASFYMKSFPSQKAFQSAIEAGDRAFSQNRFLDAQAFYEFASTSRTQAEIEGNQAKNLYPHYVESLISSGNTLEAEKIIQEWSTLSHLLNPEAKIEYLKLNVELLKIKKEYKKLLEFIQRHSEFLYSVREIDRNTFFNIKLEFCEVMMFTNDINKAYHEAIKLLKDSFTCQHTPIQARILCFISKILSNLNEEYLSEDLLQRCSDQLSDKRHSPDYIFLVRRIISYYQLVKCDYKEAIRHYNYAIDYCNEIGTFKDIPLLRFNRGLSGIFNGSYIKSEEDLCFAMEESKRLKNDLFFQNSCYWLMDLYLSLGDMHTANQYLEHTSAKKTNDWFVDYKRLHVLADKALFKMQFSKASNLYDQSADCFKTNNQMKSYEYLKVFSIISKTLGKLDSITSLTQEYDSLYLDNLDHKNRITWFFQLGAFVLSAHGGSPSYVPSEDWNPMDCKAVFLRQHLFVAKISWLVDQNKTKEAKNLCLEYEKYRKELSYQVPEKQKKKFLQHPFYKIPTI